MVQIQKKKRSESRLSVSLGEHKESGAGKLARPSRLLPSASSVSDPASTGRSNLNFSAGSRAHARGGGAWGGGGARISPPPALGHAASPSLEVPMGGLAALSRSPALAAGIRGEARCSRHFNRLLARSPTRQRSHTPPC